MQSNRWRVGAVLSSVAFLLVGCSEADHVLDPRIAAVQKDLDGLVNTGSAGAIASLSLDGKSIELHSGVADLVTRAPMPANPQVRIASITKSFTAAMVLQLVGEGKVRLDELIDVYLPGVVLGRGADGRGVTVRQILQHTSGLPEATADSRVDELAAAREDRTMRAAETVSIAMAYPLQFAPGERFAYTNTNYLVAGLLIEQVTGRRYADELQRRIVEPLGLKDTYLPEPGEREIRGPHPRGYRTEGDYVVDVSEIEPSVPWAAGGLVSSGTDLDRFFTQLIDGKVLPPAQLNEMRSTVPATGLPEGFGYGLGLSTATLPCGVRSFGHTGGLPGYITVSGVTETGDAATIVMTQVPEDEPDYLEWPGHALCR